MNLRRRPEAKVTTSVNMYTTISKLSMFICVLDVTYVEAQLNHSKLPDFINSIKIVKNIIKLCKVFCFHKISKNIKKKKKKNRSGMFCSFVCMTSFTPNSKFCNFITLWILIKTPQNFVQGLFSIELLKVRHKDRSEDVASGPL